MGGGTNKKTCGFFLLILSIVELGTYTKEISYADLRRGRYKAIKT